MEYSFAASQGKCECGKKTVHWSGKCGECRKSTCTKCGKSVRFSDASKRLCFRCTYVVNKSNSRRSGAMIEC